jgi:DnaJ-class molecular chaperone
MCKRKVLKLLQKLLRDASVSVSRMNGGSTRYYVDQEQLLKNIEAELEEESKCKECGGSGATAESDPCHKCHGYG